MLRSKILGILVVYLLIQLFLLCFSQSVSASIIFSISNPIINLDDEIEVDATISGLISSSCSTSGCYLQAEIQSAGGYFGYTFNNSGEYVDYFKSVGSVDDIKSKLYNIVPSGGSWSGKLKAKNNPLNQNYYGPGDYLLSFRRFSGNSLSPTSSDSNSIPISLSLPQVTPLPINTPEITPTPTSISFILKTAPPVLTQTPYASLKPTPIKTSTTLAKFLMTDATESAEDDSVLGTESSEVELLDSQPQSPKVDNKRFPILPVILILAGLCFIVAAVFSIIRNDKKASEIS